VTAVRLISFRHAACALALATIFCGTAHAQDAVESFY